MRVHNGYEILVRGRIAVQILLITPGCRALEWRLGGVRATIPLARAEQFLGHHMAVEI